MAKRIKGVRNPLGVEISYRNYLRKYMQKIIQFLLDEDEQAIAEAVLESIKVFKKTGSKIAQHVNREITKNFKDALGKKVAENLIHKALSPQDSIILSNFVYYNTLLITNVSNELRLKVADQVSKDPTGLPPLKQRIKDATGFSDARAKLIARDQTAKLNSELSALRHKAAGFTKYVWVTSGDERVRKKHSDLDGETYEYDAPTDEQDGLPPGQPIQCRCIAEPIFEEL